MKHIIIIFAVGLITGCASNPRVEQLTSGQRAKLASIVVYEGTPTGEYRTLGTVSGLSCNRNKHQKQAISDEEALEGIKIKAVRLGAEAVNNTFCQTNSDTDWRNNCWASVKCIGDAVVFTSEP